MRGDHEPDDNNAHVQTKHRAIAARVYYQSHDRSDRVSAVPEISKEMLTTTRNSRMRNC